MLHGKFTVIFLSFKKMRIYGFQYRIECLRAFFDNFDHPVLNVSQSMKFTSFFFAIVLLIAPTNAQQDIIRSNFSLPDNGRYGKYEVNDVENLDIDSDGTGFVWDLSSMGFQELNEYVQFQLFPDTNSEYSDNSFLAIARDRAGVNNSFELYSLTDDFLQLRGYGSLDENDIPAYDLLDKPFISLKFPWSMEDSVIYENPPIQSKRTYSAKGFIQFPGQEAIQAWKIREEFMDNDILVIQYFWYTRELPYPLLTITKRLQASDSTLLFTSGEALISESPNSITQNTQSREQAIKLIGNKVILREGLSLLKIFSLKGAEISFLNENPSEYQLIGTIPQVLFFILQDFNNTVFTHTLIGNQ